MKFDLQSPYQSAGDQPQAISQLTQGVKNGQEHQVLLGVTGSGKTFTVASVIEEIQKPTLVIAHNKTLAAQLYQEFRDFFPKNAVSYFVSYYDYYQPEAYIPSTDTYIEKDSSINDEIDKLRLATTTNLMTRPDVIVVASVSCIYNLGSPVEYGRYMLRLVPGEVISRETVLLQLANLQYDRVDTELTRGSYRMLGDVLQIWPAYEDRALRIDTLENQIEEIVFIDPISGSPLADQPIQKEFIIYPAKHYVVNPITQQEAIGNIRAELAERVEQLGAEGKQLEAYRLEQKVNYDLDMIESLGFVGGIENYSRYFEGRAAGSPPFTLLDYFADAAERFGTDGFLTVIDESHISLPQIRGMFNGDQARKKTLVDYGFRLPSALDNRPLTFSEFLRRNNQFIHISATPGDWEVSQAGGKVIEQIVRPTGLLDPIIELRPVSGQIEDLVIEIMARKQIGQRVLVTTLTKKMAEALTDYLNDQEKIDQLAANFIKKQAEAESQLDPDQIIWRGEELPLEQMAIGKIERQYHTSAKPSAELLEPPLNYPKVAYLHSDVDTMERSDILADLRRGVYDVVVGINLLREGLDLPEVSLVAILDADKEGFLRSTTSLIQTMGRAARHQEGRVFLYADKLTKSMRSAIDETQRRRQVQLNYNQEHGITPQSINKPIRERMVAKVEDEGDSSGKKSRTAQNNHPAQVIELSAKISLDLATFSVDSLTPAQKKQYARLLKQKMNRAAANLEYELAAELRDLITQINS